MKSNFYINKDGSTVRVINQFNEKYFLVMLCDGQNLPYRLVINGKFLAKLHKCIIFEAIAFDDYNEALAYYAEWIRDCG